MFGASRLRDSAEAAAIAVTGIEDQPDQARGLVTKCVENYVRDIKSTNLRNRFHQAEDGVQGS